MKMQQGTALFRTGSNVLVPVAIAPFDRETELQLLVAQNPDLIAAAAGRQPGTVALVMREAGIPVEFDGNDQFATDHLFVDSDGVPIIVEVKRSEDTRIRRKVVGQMLDYAANAAQYWSLDRLRNWVETMDDTSSFWSHRSDGADISNLAEQMHANLAGGRFQLLFVADEIPQLLRSIIEFLGRQFDTVEVAGAEIRRFGQEPSTVVSVDRITYQPETGGRSGRRPPSETLEKAIAAASSEFGQLVQLVTSFAEGRFDVVREGKSIRVVLPRVGNSIYLFPTFESLEFRLMRLRQVVGDDLVDWIRETIADLPGGTVSPAFADVAADKAVENWDRLVKPTLEEIVGRLLEAPIRSHESDN